MSAISLHGELLEPFCENTKGGGPGQLQGEGGDLDFAGKVGFQWPYGSRNQ